jgi:hypothetical protein
VASEARSRPGRFTYMGNHKGRPQIINGAISVIAKIIKSVISTAAEAEVGALFMHEKALIPLTAFKLLSRTERESNYPFDQSYQFEVTTDPIGSNYITS